jgi:hypothetical protein
MSNMRIVRNAMYNAGRTVRQIRDWKRISGIKVRFRNLCWIRTIPTTGEMKTKVALLYNKQLRKRSGKNKHERMIAAKNFLTTRLTPPAYEFDRKHATGLA